MPLRRRWIAWASRRCAQADRPNRYRLPRRATRLMRGSPYLDPGFLPGRPEGHATVELTAHLARRFAGIHPLRLGRRYNPRSEPSELRRACECLGVSLLERLGYHDSGMADWDPRHREGTFCAVPVESAASRIVQLIERYRPEVVVTWVASSAAGPDRPTADSDTPTWHRPTLGLVAVSDVRTPGWLYLKGTR